MFALMLTLATTALPAEGSRWSWSLEDTRVVKMTDGDGRVTRANSLGKSQLELTVLAVDEHAPSKLKLIITKGPNQLVDSEWEIESNYGELLARKTKGSSFKTLGQIYAGQPEPPLTEWNTTFAALARMVTPDAVVVAARSGEPCSERTRSLVAQAAALTAQRVYSVNGAANPSTESPLISSATCGAANTWNVKFDLNVGRNGSSSTVRCSGSVKVPAGAVFATYSLTCSGNKATSFTWNSTLKSALTPLK